MFHQYLLKRLRKQQWRDILLNMYFFDLINLTKLFSYLATFVNTQETFQQCLDVIVRMTSDIVKSTLKQHCVCQCWNLQRQIDVACFNFDIFDVQTMLLFSKSSYTTLIHFQKVEKNIIFEPQKERLLIWLTTLVFDCDQLKKRETWKVQCKNKRWKV